MRWCCHMTLMRQARRSFLKQTWRTPSLENSSGFVIAWPFYQCSSGLHKYWKKTLQERVWTIYNVLWKQSVTAVKLVALCRRCPCFYQDDQSIIYCRSTNRLLNSWRDVPHVPGDIFQTWILNRTTTSFSTTQIIINLFTIFSIDVSVKMVRVLIRLFSMVHLVIPELWLPRGWISDVAIRFCCIDRIHRF